MANKTWLRGAALVLIAALSLTGLVLAGCSKKDGSGGGSGSSSSAASAVKEAPETDFTVELTKDSTGVKITKYNGNAKAVRIPATMQGLPVREIGISAFSDNKTITSVIIPEGVTSLSGFAGCENLTSVNFPTTLTGYFGGFGKTKLTAVDLSGTSITMIGMWTFEYCEALTSVVLPASIKTIGYVAFRNCTALTAVTIPETVTKIEFPLYDTKDKNGNARKDPNAAFSRCSSLPLTVQAKLKELGYKDSF